METIFFVLFRSEKALHDRMEYFSEKKTLQDYMKWQFEQRRIVELDNGNVIVDKFDIKFSNEHIKPIRSTENTKE